MNFLLFIIGLCLGSFAAAFSYRYPRNISVLTGRSWCDRCRKEISWLENIPLVSFVFLKGRCRHCGLKISPRYPLIEIATAVGFVLIGTNIFNLLLLLILVLIFVVDLEHQIIPDAFVMSGIGIAVIKLFTENIFLFTHLSAGFASALFLLTVFLLTRGRGMGLGDVKFAVLGGLIVGLKLALFWMFAAFLTGAIVGIILILLGNARLKDKIAFGPFLITAIPITLVWGEKLIKLVF